MVSISSLQETNRLRKQNTKLPLYSLPTQSKTNRKSKLTSINDQPEPKKLTPCIKILKTITKPKQKKRGLSTINVDCDSLAKKSLSHYGNDYMAVRIAILNHMIDIAHFLLGIMAK